MTTTNAAMNTPLGMLPHMPLDPSWLEQHPAVYSANPALFKAAFRLLVAAWRATPCASLPDSEAFLKEVTGLSALEVMQNKEVLWHGFEPNGAGMREHLAMKRMADGLMSHYAKEIEGYSRSLALAAQSPEEFGLHGVDVRPGRKPRGKVGIPANFGFDLCPDLREWCMANGYPTIEAQDWVMRSFRDFCTSRDERFKDFAAAFRNYAVKELRFSHGKIPGLVPRSGGQAALPMAPGRPMIAGRGDAAAAHTVDLFRQVDAVAQRPRERY